MGVDPANAPALEISVANKLNNFVVRNRVRPVHAPIEVQKLSTVSAFTDEEFSVDQFVSCNLITSQERCQSR